jgi:hypothetical protein
MLLHSKDTKVEKIYDEDLQFLGKQLKEYVELYRHNITIFEPEHFKILDRLYEISHLLLTRQYDMLISDTSIISYEKDYTF